MGSHKSYVSPKRVILGVRWGWMKDRTCRRRGHVLDLHNAVEFAGAHWPICTRCGRGVASEDRSQPDAPDRVSRLQAAVDRAHSALIGSQYVGGPSVGDAFRTAVEALGEVATEHRGQDAR